MSTFDSADARYEVHRYVDNLLGLTPLFDYESVDNYGSTVTSAPDLTFLPPEFSAPLRPR